MTPCVLEMFPLAIDARLAWVHMPKERPCVVLRCTPPPWSSVHNGTTTAPFVPMPKEPPRVVLRYRPPPGSCVHNGTATAPFVAPIDHVHRQPTPGSSKSTHSEEPPPVLSMSKNTRRSPIQISLAIHPMQKQTCLTCSSPSHAPSSFEHQSYL